MNANDLIASFDCEEKDDYNGGMDDRYDTSLDTTRCTVNVSWIACEQVDTTIRSLKGWTWHVNRAYIQYEYTPWVSDS